MIRGIHGLLYSSDAQATRAFFRDKVRLPGSDIGEGWWIFDFAEGDLGVHPVDYGAKAGDHDVSFYCDDIHGTVADMKTRGVVFDGDVQDRGYGLVTYFEAPGGLRIQLYEPRYTKGSSRAAPKKAAPTKAAPKKAASKKAASKKAPSKKAAPTKPATKKPATKKAR
ncbi:MAG: hypothetical protein J0L92_25535 [Deltaproteobacteria bacterium]|nr:hypothetical protein [Deltaproteobacteria bacterium]